MNLEKILFITDAWEPLTNGVVTTLVNLKKELEKKNYKVDLVEPSMFRSVPCPSYPQIRLAIPNIKKFEEILLMSNPTHIHIVTEGPLGIMARLWLSQKGIPFTTSYHTDFAQYLNKRFSIPESWTHKALNWFHSKAKATLVTTQSIKDDLISRGYVANLIPWTRGVDKEIFNTYRESIPVKRGVPVYLYVGRIAIEKNIETFLDACLGGHKIVVGDGPQLEELKEKYKNHHNIYFLGKRTGKSLAKCYRDADVFAFPSTTDTFGIVILESIACGTPVVAFDVAGPKDIIRQGIDGLVVAEDDAEAFATACRTLGKSKLNPSLDSKYTWEECCEIFLNVL